MTNYTASNIGLYAAGGSGDNLIPNGYVKAVEKVWIDSFTWSTVVNTGDTVLIGYVPAGAKVVGVEVVIPTSFTPTTSVFSVGMSYSTGLFISASTAYISGTANKVTINNPLGQNFVPTSTTTTFSGGTVITQTVQGVYLSIATANMTAPTAGTLQTIIRYT